MVNGQEQNRGGKNSGGRPRLEHTPERLDRLLDVVETEGTWEERLAQLFAHWGWPLKTRTTDTIRGLQKDVQRARERLPADYPTTARSLEEVNRMARSKRAANQLRYGYDPSLMGPHTRETYERGARILVAYANKHGRR